MNLFAGDVLMGSPFKGRVAQHELARRLEMLEVSVEEARKSADYCQLTDNVIVIDFVQRQIVR
ncbi:MAG: hypothetical protein AAGE89_02220 [Pseudomonadota bacterium]